MNAISVSGRCSAGKDAVAVYDVGRCIRSWGRHGILFGGLIGLVLGTIFVTSPLTAGVLRFGIVGTLIVCAIECAVVGGGLGVVMAALHGRGALRGSMNGLERTLVTPSPPAAANGREEDDYHSGAKPLRALSGAHREPEIMAILSMVASKHEVMADAPDATVRSNRAISRSWISN